LKIEGTQEAFAAMIKKKGIQHVLEIERSTLSNLRTAMRAGGGKNYPSLDLMSKMLLKAGGIVKKREVWELPD
jgi:hypothetical protein